MPDARVKARASKRAGARRRFRDQSGAGDVLAFDPNSLLRLFAEPLEREPLTSNGVAVLRIEGPLERRAGGFFDCYDGIVERFAACLRDPEIHTVVLRVNSPGGDTEGLLDAVAAMRDARSTSGARVIAFADELAASAAYAISCAADEIYVAPAGGVGSIGIIATMLETTKRDAKEGLRFELITSGARKTDGNPHVAISDGARKRCERLVGQLAGMFFELVAETRGITTADVEALEADVFYGEDAVAAGLADGVMSWSDLESKLQLDALARVADEAPSAPKRRTPAPAEPSPDPPAARRQASELDEADDEEWHPSWDEDFAALVRRSLGDEQDTPEENVTNFELKERAKLAATMGLTGVAAEANALRCGGSADEARRLRREVDRLRGEQLRD